MARRLDQVIVVDVESTCWEGDPPAGQASEIIEIGVCSLDLATGQRLKRQSILVKPQHSRVSPFCHELTTLTQEQVETGMPFGTACDLLKSQYLTHERVWASYGDYDRRMFKRQCSINGIAYPFGPTHYNLKNLLAIAYDWCDEVGVAQALQRLGLVFDGVEHRGGDDAWNVAQLLCTLLAEWRAVRRLAPRLAH